MTEHWFYLSVNPEPWAIGDASVGKRAGKFFARVSPNAQLVAYQNAIKEELQNVAKLPRGEYSLTFYLWRNLAQYISESDRIVQKHQADATNMQKALEDALQGVLFDNDRDVRDVRSVIVEQGPKVIGKIAICARLWNGLNPDEIPLNVWQELEKIDHPACMVQPELDWEQPGDLF